MRRPILYRAFAALSLTLGLPVAGPAVAETLVVYSARNEQLIKPVFDAYTRETGVEVRFTTGDAAVLIERLAAEGRNSPADLLMTVDAGELWNAAERGLLRPATRQQTRSVRRSGRQDGARRWRSWWLI